MIAISNIVHHVFPDSFETGNDADNIQAAINYMANSGGGKVILRRRTYYIDKTIILWGGVYRKRDVP